MEQQQITTEHTAGPWHTLPRIDGDAGIFDESEQRELAIVHGVKIDHASTANARLIAAAPELLAAIEITADAQSLRWHCQLGEVRLANLIADKYGVERNTNGAGVLEQRAQELRRDAIAKARGQ